MPKADACYLKKNTEALFGHDPCAQDTTSSKKKTIPLLFFSPFKPFLNTETLDTIIKATSLKESPYKITYMITEQKKMRTALFELDQHQFCMWYKNPSRQIDTNLFVLYPQGATEGCSTNTAANSNGTNN